MSRPTHDPDVRYRPEAPLNQSPAGHALSHQEHARKEQVLTQHQASNIGAYVGTVLKRDELFLLTDRAGDIPCDEPPRALGLYYRDTRFLDGYELTLNGLALVPLSIDDSHGYRGRLYLTNRPLAGDDGTRIEPCTLEVLRDRLIRNGSVVESITIRNFARAEARLVLCLRLRSRFEDLFVLKGFVAGPRGSVLPPELLADGMRLRYHGFDGILRITDVGFDPPPECIEPGVAWFTVALAPNQGWSCAITIRPALGDAPFVPRSRDRVSHWLSLPTRRWPSARTGIVAGRDTFDRVARRAFSDLGLLRSRIDGLHYFAAGIPWFVTLFGRDSALVAAQMVPFAPAAARETALLLARFQARSYDAYRDAAPGKILHELRRGELARTNEIPQSPAYYGSIDSTLLYLILIAEYVDWTGDVALAESLRPSIDLALRWIDDDGDHDGDGYLDYVGRYGHGLLNQGWKDSGNGIPNADGSIPEPPIALVEVQGYLYQAWRSTARVLRRLGEDDRAATLDARAADLRERFDRDFWSDELGFYRLGRQRGGASIESLASNGAHVLKTGIAMEFRVDRVARRILEPDLFSGWGIRTLSSAHPAFNPMSYHLGSVWPHDNAAIIAGLCRYGQRDVALEVFDALVDAATHLEAFRLPELYCGYARTPGERSPVAYPVACKPQAWAAAALIDAMIHLLGIEADACRNRLHVVRPRLPRWTDSVRVTGLRLGSATLDLHFARNGDGVRVQAENVVGEATVESD